MRRLDLGLQVGVPALLVILVLVIRPEGLFARGRTSLVERL